MIIISCFHLTNLHHINKTGNSPLACVIVLLFELMEWGEQLALSSEVIFSEGFKLPFVVSEGLLNANTPFAMVADAGMATVTAHLYQQKQ